MVSYILIPVFVLFVGVYKFWNKTKWVRLEEMDIWTGRRELVMDEIEVPKEKKWWERARDVVVG